MRRLALAGAAIANATAGSIRLKLFKLEAVVAVGVRRFKLAFATACPMPGLFEAAVGRLQALRGDGPPIAAAA